MAEKIIQRIFVGNLPFKATEDDLTKFLKLSSDAVVEIPVFRHNPRRKIGIAFVNVDIGGVEDVLKFNDEEMMGRKLKISMAKNQSKQERWQPKKVSSRSGDSSVVMQARPPRGIPQGELDRLRQLRERLAELKVSSKDDGDVKDDDKNHQVSKLEMIDVAANLTNFRYNNDLEQVISRALSHGVHKMVMCSNTLEDAQQAIIVAESLPGVLYCTVGVHPHHAKLWNDEGGALLRSLLDNPQVVAVGECGLDYFRKLSSTNKQLEAFESQIQIACDTKKPLFVHDRLASKDVISTLQKYKDQLPPTLIHCFTGTEEEAVDYIKEGFYLGVTGFITKQDRGKMLREILMKKVIPLDQLVIETDCPFMMPAIPKEGFWEAKFTEIKKGRNNEPCTLVLVADSIAQCLGVSIQEVVNATTKNAIKFFNIS